MVFLVKNKFKFKIIYIIIYLIARPWGGFTLVYYETEKT